MRAIYRAPTEPTATAAPETFVANAIESLHMQLRKIVKTSGHFPTDEAATKLLCLALRNIEVKWQQGDHAWKAAAPYIAMLFDTRFTDSA